MESKNRQVEMAAQGLVLASVAARRSGFSLSTIHRAVSAGRVRGVRVGKRLFVDWFGFRHYAGAALSVSMPATAADAVEADHAC